MKKIGFIDYYISEWHANNYPVWIKELESDYEVCYAWAEKDISDYEKCENIIILAPSNPEKHLGYIEEAFKCGKRIYVDKTFAPDFATAKKIFEISEKYNTPFFSTSALRYAEELDGFTGKNCIAVKGGGSNLPEYIIHQIEMVVKVLGIGAKKLMLTEKDGQTVINILYDDKRTATLHYERSNKFAISSGDGFENATTVNSPYFMNLIKKIIAFFETGEVDFDGTETLEVMKIREAIIKAQDTPNQWVELL